MSLFDNQPELPKKRSTAHRRLEKSRREITMEHIRNMVPNSIPMLVNCNCSQAPYPHTAHTDEKEYFEKQRKMKHEPI